MPYYATVVSHTPWNCRWSRLIDPESGVAEEWQPKSLWVCVRPTLTGNARSIKGIECAACPYWEASSDRPN